MNKETFKKALKDWNGMLEYINNIPNFNESGFYIRETTDFIDTMFKRFCPFDVGDKVKLTKTPIINEKESGGWMGFKHLLKKGCVGKIDEVGFSNSKFCFIFIPDRSTWIDSTGKEHLYEEDNRKPRFSFNEDWLEKIL